MALEELGATFVKLGQILSTRADLLPPDYQAELAKLQDAAPPVPWEVIAETLGMELGQPIAACFATFDPTPLAAASIGQAHAATLPNGAEVVVKVRRPGVVEQIEEDLDMLQHLAAAASRRWEFADQYDLVGLARWRPTRSGSFSNSSHQRVWRGDSARRAWTWRGWGSACHSSCGVSLATWSAATWR